MIKSALCLLLFFSTVLPACLNTTSEDTAAIKLGKKFTHHYFDYFSKDPAITYGTTFLGVVVMQHPADMWVMQELITNIRPDFIIETGTAAGGSALYYATILKEVNSNGKVITVDIDPHVEQISFKRLQENPPLYRKVKNIFDDYIEIITSNSVDPALIKHLREQTKGKKVMVTLDSCHNYEHVLKELFCYSELVSPGSYLIVQDTFLDEKEEWVEKYAGCSGWGYTIKGGPRKAVEEFLMDNHDFIADRSCEKFLLTFYPSVFEKSQLGIGPLHLPKNPSRAQKGVHLRRLSVVK